MINKIMWSSNEAIDDNLLTDIVNIVKDMGEDIRCPSQRFYSTYFIGNRPEYIFEKYYRSIVDKIVFDFDLKHRLEYSCNFWMQVYDPNESDQHHVHDHFTSQELFSWVHFVRPTKQKCFYFTDSDGNKSYPKQDKNDFIAFPPWVNHGVDRPDDDIDVDRVVIAGNVMFDSIIDQNRAKVLKRSLSNPRLFVTELIPKTYDN
tara:strand:- start:505 stop:1113 length:609 start_codon:yes stop_codon:yes gene_type:complete